jgi:hypothetical protein
VSRSIKNPDHGDDSAPQPATPPPPAQPQPQDEKAGHEQLLADLDAFVAGEQAAQQPGKHTDAESDSSRETGRDAP